MTHSALNHSTDGFDGDDVGEVSLPVTNTKGEAEIFSSRAAQFVEDHSIFLSEIVAEQLVLPPAHCKRLKQLPAVVHESIREFLWNPALKADQLISYMSSKFPQPSANRSGSSIFTNPLQVRWQGVHPNHIELIIEAVRFVHAAFGQDHLREPRTLRSELDRFNRLHSSASSKLDDSQIEVILSWWFPQLIELLALLRLKGPRPHSAANAKSATDGNTIPPDITSAFLKCYDAFEGNSIIALYLLSGEYLIHPVSLLSSTSNTAHPQPIAPSKEQTPGSAEELSLERRFTALREKSRKHTELLRKAITQAYTEFHVPNAIKSRSLQSLAYTNISQETKSALSMALEVLLSEDNFTLVLALSKLKLMKERGDELCKSIVQYYKFQDRLIPLLSTAISLEISETSASTSLFRGESPATKMLSTHMYDQGLDYLRYVTHHLIVEIVVNNQDLEIDPQKAAAGTDVLANLEKVLVLTQDFLKTLFKSADQCPITFRLIFAHAQREVQNRFPEMKQLVVGAFLFLRFICPALVSPERYGLLPSDHHQTSPQARRGLILVSKVLQNLANSVEFDGSKEEYMRSLNRLITRNMDSVRRFFDELADETKIGGKAGEAGKLASLSSVPSSRMANSRLSWSLQSRNSSTASLISRSNTLTTTFNVGAEDMNSPVNKVMEYLRSSAIDCILGSILEPGVPEEILEYLKSRQGTEESQIQFRSFLLKQSPSVIKNLIQRQDVLASELVALSSRLGEENCRRLLGFHVRANQLSRNDSEVTMNGNSSSAPGTGLETYNWDSETREIEAQINYCCASLPPSPQRSFILLSLKRVFKLHRFLDQLYHKWQTRGKSKEKTREFKELMTRQLMIASHLWNSVCEAELPFSLPDSWSSWTSFKLLFESTLEYLYGVLAINPIHPSGRDALCLIVAQTKWTISRVMELQIFVKLLDL